MPGIKKLWRGLQRSMKGESNKQTINTGMQYGYADGGGGGVSRVSFPTSASISKTGHANQLEFEKSHVIIEGSRKDVRRVRRLDNMIGSLLKPFNGAAKVPDKVISKINLHIQDVEDSLQRISAYKVNIRAIDVLSAALSLDPSKLEHKTPVKCIEYGHSFQNSSGAKIEQPIAKIQLRP